MIPMKEELICKDVAEYQVYQPKEDPRYIVDTVIQPDVTLIMVQGKAERVWAVTTIYDARLFEREFKQNILEKTPPKEGAVLSFSAQNKAQAVAFHKIVSSLLKRGATPEELNSKPEYVHQIIDYLKKNSKNEDFILHRGIRERFLTDLQKVKNPQNSIRETAQKVRNVFMYDNIAQDNGLAGHIKITEFEVETWKRKGHDFVTRVYELGKKNRYLIGEMPSTTKPNAKHMHKDVCEAIELCGKRYPEKLNEKKKGIHPHRSTNELQR